MQSSQSRMPAAPGPRSRRLVLVPARCRTAVHSSGVESCRPWHERRTVGEAALHAVRRTKGEGTGVPDLPCEERLVAAFIEAARALVAPQTGGMPAAGSDARTRELEHIGVDRDEGPCRDCFRSAQPVTGVPLDAASWADRARPGPGRHCHDRPPPAARPTATDPVLGTVGDRVVVEQAKGPLPSSDTSAWTTRSPCCAAAHAPSGVSLRRWHRRSWTAPATCSRRGPPTDPTPHG